jgi:hypothetical protein
VVVTVDACDRMGLVSLVTGERHALPEITTIPCLNTHTRGASFTLGLKTLHMSPSVVLHYY